MVTSEAECPLMPKADIQIESKWLSLNVCFGEKSGRSLRRSIFLSLVISDDRIWLNECYDPRAIRLHAAADALPMSHRQPQSRLIR